MQATARKEQMCESREEAKGKVKWGQRQKRGCERRSRKGKGKERERERERERKRKRKRKRKKRKKLYKEATRQKRVSDTLKASRNIANAEVS